MKSKRIVLNETDKIYEPLFDAFKLTYRYLQKGFTKQNGQNVLTREDLDSIENLNIKFSLSNNYKKLFENIDKLVPNLKSLEIGTTSDVYLTKNSIDAINSGLRILPQEDEIKRRYLEKIFSVNKLNDDDLKHIQNLSKLEYLSIPNQNKITKFDLSNMKNLKVLHAKNCENLVTIKGLNNKLFDTNYATYDFTGCEKLSDDTIKHIAEKFDIRNFKTKRLSTGHMFLPLNVMLRKNIKNIQNFVDFTEKFNKDTVMFSQITGGVLLNHYAVDTQKFCKELDKIISKNTSDEKSKLKNIISLYTWLVNNIEYDHKTIEKENSYYLKINKNFSDVREAGENRSERTRSVIYTLKNKLGVCVGISDLFACLVYRAGLSNNLRKVICSTKEPKSKDELVILNHQIMSIEFENAGLYYFDPTLDLGGGKIRNFALNKEEISKKYTLSPRERHVENAPSLYKKHSQQNENMHQI